MMAESKKRTLEELSGDDDEGNAPESRSVKQKVELQVNTVPSENNDQDNSDKYYGADSKSSDSANSSNSGMGFLAYAKINPFAAAQGNAFGQPSPNSPQNPFGATSPKHNPFMSFVDKKEEYWNMMSTNPSLAKTSAMFGFTSDTVKNTMINARSGAGDSTEKKSQFGAPATAESTEALKTGDIDRAGSGGNSPVSGNESDTASPEKPLTYENEVSSSSVVNGEEGEECIFQVRAKLFRLGTKEAVQPTKPALCGSQDSKSVDEKSSTVTDKKLDDNSLNEQQSGDCQDLKSEASAPAKEETKEYSSSRQPPDEDKSVTAVVTEWVEVGTGPLRVLRPSTLGADSEPAAKVSHPRVVMRRECQPGGNGTKLILNEFLHGHAAVSKMSDKAVRLTVITMLDDKPQPISYLLKTKLSTETDKLEKWMSDLLASAK